MSPFSASELKTQFKLPPASGGPGSKPSLLPKRLSYQYGYGSDSEINYLKDIDLNRGVRDNSLIFVPEFSGYLIYRPVDWLETGIVLAAGGEVVLAEEKRVKLPDGEVIYSQKRKPELRADEAYVMVRKVTDPFEVTVGRKAMGDDRRWLYDTTLDVATISLKGKFQVDFSAGREFLVDLETTKFKPDRIDTYILYMDYRGIEDMKLAGYSILRYDRNKIEGRPMLTGLRTLGWPTPHFRYWTDLAHLGGEDELSRDFEAYALDVGSVYFVQGLLGNPFVILDFAYATGNDPKNKKKNRGFRQTGLQSNEVRFGGIPEVRMYGEALDPELSNIRIITAGLAFRLGPDLSFDLIFHRYRLNEIVEEVAGAQLTGLLNIEKGKDSRDLGSAFDFGIGGRNLFGLRRLGIDIRAGMFFPGPAYRTLVLTPRGKQEQYFPADQGISVVTKFWW